MLAARATLDLAVMAARIFLHVGTPKSGTTYLQSLLWHNRGLLAERGLIYPGMRHFDQNRASIEVRRGAHLRSEQAPVWNRFLRRAATESCDLVLSNEWYVAARPAQLEGAIEQLSAHGEVHVVLTARDLVGQIPAGWQETLKLGTGVSLEGFVERLDDPDQRWRWSVLDAAEALEPWARVVAPERIHVVTLPRGGGPRDLLWRRFLGVMGQGGDGTDLGAASANESLGVESAVLLQRFGPALLEALDPANSPWQTPYNWLRNYISHEVLVPLGGAPIGLPDALVETLRARSARMVGRLGAAGYELVGDTADLLDGAPKPGSVQPDAVSTTELLDRAGVLAARLLADLRRADEGTDGPHPSGGDAVD